MAFALVTVQRHCPASFFEQLEPIIAGCVGDVIYDTPDPDEADVTVAILHGFSKRFMEINVAVDLEDLPGPQAQDEEDKEEWVVSESGLCVPKRIMSRRGEGLTSVDPTGPTEEQLQIHQIVQGRRIWGLLLKHTMWTPEEIGWDPTTMDPEYQLGALVAKTQGGWSATDTHPKSQLKSR